MLRVTLEIPFSSNKIADEIIKVLESEKFQKRANSSIDRKGDKVIVTIVSQDLAALHATVNSFMRALKVIQGVLSLKER